MSCKPKIDVNSLTKAEVVTAMAVHCDGLHTRQYVNTHQIEAKQFLSRNFSHIYTCVGQPMPSPSQTAHSGDYTTESDEDASENEDADMEDGDYVEGSGEDEDSEDEDEDSEDEDEDEDVIMSD